MRVGAFSNLVAISEIKLLKQELNGEMEWVFRSNDAKEANLKVCSAGPAGTCLLN